MPDSLPQSILCPILIGRDAQIATLTRLLDQARAGQGQIVLISGEAGIGKSRLVAVAKLMIEQSGFVISAARLNSNSTIQKSPRRLQPIVLRRHPGNAHTGFGQGKPCCIMQQSFSANCMV